MIKLRKVLLFKSIYITLFIISLIYLVIYINIDFTSKFEGSETKVEGVIESIEYQGNKMTLTLKTKEKLIATYYFDTEEELNKTKKELSLGDTLTLKGELNEPISSKNFYGFSYPTYLKYQKIFYIMKVSDYYIKHKNSNILYSIRNVVRSSISNDKVGSYIKVFFLGDDTSFDTTLEEDFRNLGISHLFALSGTQISFLISIITLRKKTINLNNLLFIFSILICYYLIIEDCAAIDRALIFSLVFSLNNTFNLNIRPLFLILLSLSILFFINPYYIFDVGFQYSTVISCTLILYMNNKKSKGKIIDLLEVSWVSFLVSLPISLYHFSYINPLSIIYNLFYVPFINVIIFPLSIACFFIPHLSFILEFFINIFEGSVLFLSHINIGYITLARFNLVYYLLYFVLIFSYLFLKIKKKLFLYLILLMIVVHYSYPKVFPKDALYMIDVGQGDSFLLTSNNKAMLIDTGGVMSYYQEDWMQYEKSSQGKYLVTFLNQLGITKLDYLVITHGDYDHAGEALTIMDEIDVGTVFFNGNDLNSLEKKIWVNSSSHYKLREGDSFRLGNFNFLVISNTYTDENDSSLVLYSTIDNKKLLFMGDASIKSEKYILDNYNLSDITILKVGHHGSRTSSSEEFIDVINPTYALISAGVDNKFNHPHKEVVERLEENGSLIYNTGVNGMVMFDFTNNKIKTCTRYKVLTVLEKNNI